MDSSRVRKIFKHKSGYTKVNIPNLLLRSFTLICSYVGSNMSFTFIQKRYSIKVRLAFSMTTPFFTFTNKIKFYSKEPAVHPYIFVFTSNENVSKVYVILPEDVLLDCGCFSDVFSCCHFGCLCGHKTCTE